MAKKQFKAESKRLLYLMINSIYTHKEIFLREIISNASDACDKLCYQALTDDSVKLTRKDFKIDLSVNKDARTITVTDNGIGMDKEDLENNLGVIASSGSYKFKQEVGDDTKDTDVIGQFGVGFYSAFMVASKVTVISRAYGQETANRWESEGADGYTVTPCEKDGWGTDPQGSVLDTMAHFNAETLVIPQCETAEALADIEAIAATEGVDGIFIGPFDLSISMGMPGDFENPQFKAALERILAACHAAGKPCLIFTGDGAASAARFAQGYDGVAMSLDTMLLISGVRAQIAAAK